VPVRPVKGGCRLLCFFFFVREFRILLAGLVLDADWPLLFGLGRVLFFGVGRNRCYWCAGS